VKISDLTTLKYIVNSPIGLDVGATSVSMAQLKRTSKGWSVRDMQLKEIPVSNEENGGSRKDAIIQTIKDILKSSSFSGRSVVSVMPDYQLDIFPVKLALSGDNSVEEAILKEAGAHLSYKAENAVIDYLLVDNDEDEQDKARTVSSLLLAARREDVDEHLSILRGAKLKPIAIDIAACALSRIIRASSAKQVESALIINMGQLHSTLTLLWEDNILLDRNIPWGRENMIEILMNKLKLKREEADRLLNRVGLHPRQIEDAGPESETNEQTNRVSEAVYEIVAPQLEKLAKEIDKVFQYVASEMRGATIDDIYLTGEGSNIKNLDIYLIKRTDVSTKYFNPLSALQKRGNGVSEDNNSHDSFYSVALGLAMRGLENQDMTNGRE